MTDTNLTSEQRLAAWTAQEFVRLNAEVARLTADKRQLTAENRIFLQQLKEGRTHDAQAREQAEDALYRAKDHIHELERRIALMQIENDRRSMDGAR